MTNTTELRECPFCSSRAMFVEPDERGSGGQWVGPIHVGCSQCKAEQQADTEAEAIAAWNRRASAVPEGVAKLLLKLRDDAVLSEGQISKALGVDRLTCREILDGVHTAPAKPASEDPLIKAAKEFAQAHIACDEMETRDEESEGAVSDLEYTTKTQAYNRTKAALIDAYRAAAPQEK